MAIKISYFIIFGIVTIANGKPAADTNTYLVKDEFELEKLLHTLAKEGKYTPNEDKARKPLPLRYHYDDRANDGQYYSSRENVAGKRQEELKLINEILAKNVNNYPASQNAQNLLEDLLLFRENDNNENADDNANADVADLLNDIQKNLADDGSYVSQLRCAGNRCQDKRVSADDRDDEFANVRSNANLVCIGDKCTRTVSDSHNNPNDVERSRYNDQEGNLRFNSKQLAKKVKISDDLDAVVLGMSDVDRLLTNFNSPRHQRTHKVTGTNLVQNIDLNRLLNSESIGNKKSNVEAVVFDLTQVENGDAVAKQIKQVLSHGDTFADNSSEEDYDEYGNLVEEHLKRGVYNLDKPAKTAKRASKILAHNEENNNVYVPQWLLDQVMSKSHVRAPSDDELLKSLLPTTKQQKEKKKKNKIKNKNKKPTKKPLQVFRRNFDQDVGVPFHLEVQGLGQVNP